jgi:RNA polymerase sigma factor (sigma-70 family)
MQSTDDRALLRQYAENNSDEAFAALVTRHVSLVYSVALRQVGNPHHAEEITQAVFIILARKAAALRHDKALSSWLFQATRLTANNFVRSESRRHRREDEAYMQSVLEEAGTEVWPKIAPFLDDAVANLREKDRRAILLRFYEGRNLREVGAVLGASEDAAEKRVNRALEKLRHIFAKRGVSSTTAILAGAISAHSVQAVPVTLAKSVTAVALAKGAAASTSTLTLIKGALKIMAWTKAKTAIVAGAAVILAAGTVTPIVIHHYRANSSIFSSKTELTDADNANYQKLTGTTPAQVAQTFFDVCAKEDWAEAAKYWPPGLLKRRPDFMNGFTNYFGGLEIVSLGKPFKGRIILAGIPAGERKRMGAQGARKDFDYPGVYVPYEIRVKCGDVRKWQLAIRCDNPEHHWYFDGGM